ncbi:MAG: rhomboid family intramembrane serine protease [Ferruginibacter sp.]
MQRTTPIVLNLIIINVLVWIAQLFFDKGGSFGLTRFIALFPPGSGFFEPYQLVTYMFAHSSYDAFGNISFFHILFNMYALWIFGTTLENYWGPKRFLIFYLSCGLAAGVVQMLIANSPVVGASGAVMGLLAGFAYLFPNTEFFIIPIPFPIKAKYMAMIYAAIDLFGGVHPGSGDTIAHFAHLGGLVMGFILVIIWNKTNRKTFY